ncbi:hypothetical protein BKA70DRAFT_731649 [Coprinopsis sp. MPI-PUGE-AT-0042]|nr:hypothetical protein BKA70DRAFT_731649 [Coprinopsis sp. MPI-PUGE-AT-0042]
MNVQATQPAQGFCDGLIHCVQPKPPHLALSATFIMSEQHPQPRKRGIRGRLSEWKQRLKGSPSASPLPSGASTPRTTEPLPSNYQVHDPAQRLPPSAIDDSGAETPSVPSEGPLKDEDVPAPPHPDQVPSRMDKAKDYLNVTSSLLQLVLKEVPDVIDSNPVKVFFSLANTVLKWKEGMNDNRDAVEQHLIAISRLLVTVEAALNDWASGDASEETKAMDAFQQEAGNQLEQLIKIKSQSQFRNFALQEDDKQKIAQIFAYVDQARQRLMLATATRIHKLVAALEADFGRLLPDQLMISRKADYMYDLAGEETALGRSECTLGTRTSILEAIIHWATNYLDSETIFWLSGHGGTGKTTIAYTICRRIEALARQGDAKVALGGTFFCSRQFPETRAVSAIIRTIVYRLSLQSKAFKAALKEHGRFETVDHGPKSQLEALLIEPWKKSALGRLADNEPVHIIPIDALDELERERGSEFLHTLFNAVKDHQLTGLKFLVTSRLDHDLVKEVESFHSKQVCRLEQVPVEETNADIKLFLEEHLGNCASKEQILQLVSDAAGLFIYAATVVEYLRKRDNEERKSLLARLIATSPSSVHRRPRGATAILDNLYIQILEATLVDPRDRDDLAAFEDSLSILHTFLCTVERTSTSVVVGILNATRDEDEVMLQEGDANGILRRLHAVLYIRGAK